MTKNEFIKEIFKPIGEESYIPDEIRMRFSEGLIKAVLEGTSEMKPTGLLSACEKQMCTAFKSPIVAINREFSTRIFQVTHANAVVRLDGLRIRTTYFDELKTMR